MKQFFETLPDDLAEAARMDGCSEFRIFWNIYLPLILPAAITLGIMTFQSGVEQFYVAYDSFEFKGNDDDSGRGFPLSSISTIRCTGR